MKAYDEMTTASSVAFDKAIVILDALVPDWTKHIDPNELNLADPDLCIFAQLGNAYREGKLPYSEINDCIWEGSRGCGPFGFLKVDGRSVFTCHSEFGDAFIEYVKAHKPAPMVRIIATAPDGTTSHHDFRPGSVIYVTEAPND